MASRKTRVPATPKPEGVKMLLIPQPIAQAVVDYLAQRPYAEVHGLVGPMVALKPPGA